MKVNLYFVAGQSNANLDLAISLKTNAFLADGEDSSYCQINLGGQHSSMWTDEHGVRGPRWNIDLMEFDACINAFEVANIEPVVKGFVWWQGERDALEIESSLDLYPRRLERYIDDIYEYFRSRWQEYSSNMVLVDMLIGINPRAASFNESLASNVAFIRDSKRCIANERPWCVNVDTQHYPRINENNHQDLWHPAGIQMNLIGHDVIQKIVSINSR